MLKFSREIETEVQGNPTDVDLYVGFQKADKLQGELLSYRGLQLAGVRLAAYGEGSLPETLTDLEDIWTPLSRNVHALENQWFLVSSSPSPIAFIGWEISSKSVFGIGRLSAPNKEFKGFGPMTAESSTPSSPTWNRSALELPVLLNRRTLDESWP